MPNVFMGRAKGLFTFQNFLSFIPEGSLLDATNVVIDRDGVIEPRRGIKGYGEFGIESDRASQLLNYKNKVLVHYNTTLAYDGGGTGVGNGTFTDYTMPFVEVNSGLRLRSVELNGNMYVTNSIGVIKVAANNNDLSTAHVTYAGGIAALDGVEVTVDYATPGFLLGLSMVGYRIVWGTTDVNTNLVLGSPSSRVVITNFNTTAATTTITFPIPQGITTDYFYQIYRTALTTQATVELLIDSDPGDEMQLVYEAPVTAGDISAGSITISDITPDSFRQSGAYLYTNPVTGQGILQSNTPPPVCTDVALYNGSVFYANTRTAHSANLNLLGLDALNHGNISNITATNPAVITSASHGLINGQLVAIVGAGGSVDGIWPITFIDANTFSIPVDGTGSNPTTGSWYSSYITIASGLTTNRYFFVGRPQITDITFDTQANTTDGSWFQISAANNDIGYFVWFDKTGTTTPPTVSGYVGIRVDISTVPAGTNVASSVFNAVLTATNDFLMIESDPNIQFTTANSGVSAVAVAGSTPPGGTFAINTTQLGQGEDKTKNYVLLSTFISAAEAINSTANSLIRIVNENSLDVVYGTYLSSLTSVPGLMAFQRRDLQNIAFTIIANNAATGALFSPDLTAALTSTAETRPNRIYFSKYQQAEAVPLVNFLDVGPKDKAILRIIALRDSLFIFKQDAIYRLTGDIAPNFSIILFDNSVHLIAPDTAAVLNNQIYSLTDGGIATVTETGVGIISRPIENTIKAVTTDNYPNFSTASFGLGYETERSYYLWTVTNTIDSIATQCFRYNTFTQCWTRWDKPQTCGVINYGNNKLFLGDADINKVDVERKSLTRLDYADNELILQIPESAVLSNTTLKLSTVSTLIAGDALIQTQYVTIDDYNSLLLKLDDDPRIGIVNPDVTYFTTLQMFAGDNLTDKMLLLVAKLNADPGTDHGYVFDGSSDFATIQTEYNTMIAAMNLDSKLKFDNYLLSSGTIAFEIAIDSIDRNHNIITSNNIGKVIPGPITGYEGIQESVVWAPNSGGDPSLLKHYNTNTILFQSSNFRGGVASYASDLSPGYESIIFPMDDSGTWGGFIWGENTWGGGGTSVPFRTFIPRQKQRCRFIIVKFTHNDAFYNPAILGTSLEYNVTSDRAYRGK